MLNGLLHAAEGTELSELISMSTLRAMTQAYYSPDNMGHFGLALRSYAHFTSPIRRYSDLIVHRALITAHGWGDDGLSDWDLEHLEATAKLISEAERRSMVAERDTNDRYLAAFLADQIGAKFTGRISGVQSFGAFVRLDETGADALIPVRSLGAEYFRYDRDEQTLTGTETGSEIGLGQRVTVRLAEAAPMTGGLIVELLEIEGERRRPAAPPSRKRKLRKAPKKRRR
jgi:ribonuclease R